MRLSDALDAGAEIDLPALSLKRYGYPGDLADGASVVAWLRDNPIYDVEALPVAGSPKVRETEVRERQAEFRALIGDAYGWRCAITGCAERSALQAAHLRPWRSHNTANDGILLRADLHCLMDAGKLRILAGYTVSVTSPCYREFDGRKLRLPRARQDWPRL